MSAGRYARKNLAYENNDEMKINNIDKLDDKFIWRDEAGLATLSLGKAAGSERICVNIDRVPPRKRSTKYHSHSA